MTSKIRRVAATVAASLPLAAVAASPAQAGVLVESADNCAPQALEQTFARWLDPLFYTPLPGGSMEDGTPGWTLSGGARVVPGNEPFYVNSASDTRSLELPRGSSARSATMCVGLDHLTMRFFARSTGGLLTSLTSSLKVEVLFETASGSVASAPVGVVPASPSWQPTLPVPVVANLLVLLPEAKTPVAFRFTPVGGASWQIDDVYVDPRWR